MFKAVQNILLITFLICLSAIVGCSGGGDGDDSTSPDSETVEMLSDRSFDSDVEGNPEDWWVGGDHVIDFTDLQARSGVYSGLIVSESGTEDFGFIAQTVTLNIPIGATLTLSAYIKTDAVTGEGLSLVIRGDDTEDVQGNAEFLKTTDGDIIINGTQDWIKYNVTSDVVPDNIKSITVYLLMDSGTTGSVYFDDISLTYIGEVE